MEVINLQTLNKDVLGLICQQLLLYDLIQFGTVSTTLHQFIIECNWSHFIICLRKQSKEQVIKIMTKYKFMQVDLTGNKEISDQMYLFQHCTFIRARKMCILDDQLKYLKNCRFLDLCGNFQITDTGIKELDKKIEHLGLRFTKVTDNSFDILKKCKSLDLILTPISRDCRIKLSELGVRV